MKTLDPNETREWVLNNRVADRVEQLLKQNYTGYQLLRIDDTTGETDIPLQKRTDAANQWKADLYLSIHHNAGINGGKGGGIIAIVYTDPKNESVQWQQAFYDELIRQTGLKGNRAEPLTRQNLHEVRETVMPAVLLELGFMDSSVDVPIILTDKFADHVPMRSSVSLHRGLSLPERAAQIPFTVFRWEFSTSGKMPKRC